MIPWRTALCLVLAAFFLAAGLLHFRAWEEFTRIVPPFVPLKREVVWMTGAMEILFAAGFVVPRWRRVTGRVVALYLLAVLPANVWQAWARVAVAGMVLPDWAAWGRVALQVPLIWLVLEATAATVRVERPPAP